MKDRLLIYLAAIAVLARPVQVLAQPEPADDLEEIFAPAEIPEKDFSEPLRNATNDISILSAAGFLFYKTCISSQDKPSCIFTPSCSVYAMEAIREKGVFLGWLSAFDRLSRCHGLVNHEHYPFDTEKMRYHDPVD